jgi:hypothetical protein
MMTLAPAAITCSSMAAWAPLPSATNGDDGGNADDHAERGQQGAHEVAPEGVEGNREGRGSAASL